MMKGVNKHETFDTCPQEEYVMRNRNHFFIYSVFYSGITNHYKNSFKNKITVYAKTINS